MLIALLSTLAALFCLPVFLKRWKYDMHRIPSTPGLPILGHSYDLATGVAKTQLWLWLRIAFRQLGYPRIIRFNIGSKYWLFVCDPSFNKDVMNSKTKSFPRFLDDGGYFLPVLGNDASAKAMWFIEGPTPYVKACRKCFTTAFSGSNLIKMTPKLNSIMNKMLEIVENKRQTGAVDFQDLCCKLTLDVIGSSTVDLNFGALDGSRPLVVYLEKVAAICDDFFVNPLKRKFCEWFPWTEAAKAYKHDIDALNAEWEWIVQEIESRNPPEEGEEPYWWLLKKMEDPETGKRLGFKSMRAEVASIVIAGMETTGQQLAWILSLLGSHPKVSDTLLEEFKAHGLHHPEGKEITYQDLGDLSYLTAVIKEGMRIAYVIRASFARSVPEDMDILGYRVPKGTLISFPGTRSIDSEEMWGDPHVFRPERWMTEEDMSDKYSVGFSSGPRDCLGQRLAMVEMRLGILKVMQRYHLELEGDWKEILDTAVDLFVTKAKGGIWLRATPRVFQ